MKHPIPPEFRDLTLRIAVAGCGGNGCQILTGLARMHVALTSLGHPGLAVAAFDPDTVTPANIGRQLFSPSDLGANKAQVLIHRLNLYYGLNWTAVDKCYNAGSRWGDENADILIGCVDSAAARHELAQTRYKYWLDLGNTDKKGQVILGTKKQSQKIQEAIPQKGPKKEPLQSLPNVLHLFPELTRKGYKEDNRPSCSLAEALERQDLFINQWLATAALQLLWQFIRQGGLDIHGYYINLETGRVTPLPIK